MAPGTFTNGATITSGSDVFLINYADNGDGGILANDISLTVVSVPEPGAWLVGGFALLAVGYTQRQRPNRVMRRS